MPHPTPKTILDLTADKSRDFLMQSRQYCDIELPDYFDFQPVLDYCREVCKGIKLPAIPNNIEGVNLEMITNKDGRYGVRPLTVANPFLYTFMVQTICTRKAWRAIVDCFKAFRVDNIQVCSLPLVPQKGDRETFYKSVTILNWWAQMEQQPIELSLKYRYMFVSDITNCYGQILPQSIDWALSRRGTDLATDANHKLAAKIIDIIEAMQGGRKLGIPQGSVLYGFLAEIVLGYADLLLDRAIKAAGITADYKVLRYVDDYRIFCNDRSALEQISYLLQHMLEDLNFRMNTSKTKISDSIVADALKPDKAFYIFNTPVFSKKGIDFDGFQKHLYFIFEFGRKFPNSTQLKVQMSEFSKRLEAYLNPEDDKESDLFDGIDWGDDDIDIDEAIETMEAVKNNPGGKVVKTYGADLLKNEEPAPDSIPSIFRPKLIEKVLPMVAILVQTASDNIGSAHYALRIISQLVDTVKNEDEKNSIITLVYNRMRHLPNSAYLQLWLQILTNPINDPFINDYDTPLCRVVNTPADQLINLWNNSWLPAALTAKLPTGTVIDREKQKKQGQLIRISQRPSYDAEPEWLG